MYLVIDIGGTKTLIALFNKRGRVIKKYKFKTPSAKSEFLGTLKSALIPFSATHGTLGASQNLLRRKSSAIQQIVIAVPGNIEHNIAISFGNRPWKNIDFARELKNLFTAPITLVNDADLGAVYESTFHRGRTLYLTFSTGIGGGIANRGHLAKNSNTLEPGHIHYIFDGKDLEWEDIASCNAIGAAYGVQATSVRGQAAYEDIAFRVSLGLPHLIQRYHPDTIVIGGPLARQFPNFKSELRKNLRRFLPRVKKLPRVTPAKRPTEAVVYGGYTYAKKLRA